MMNKYRFLLMLVIGLLLSNILLIVLLAKGHPKKNGPRDFIIEKLHFDGDQVKQYDAYIQVHRKNIRDNDEKMMALRNQLYQQLKFNQKTSNTDSLFSAIAKQQEEAEKINYQHFLEIKKLCKPNQQEDFNELTDEIVTLFSHKKRD